MGVYITLIDDVNPVVIDHNKKKVFRGRLVRAFEYLCVVVAFLWVISDHYKIAFNWTDSVPGSVFLIIKDTKPKKGELAAFNIPENDFYRNIWFTKYVAGVEGDVFSTAEKDGFLHIYLNDKDMGKIKRKSRNGIDLEPVTRGVIPEGYYFMWTPHIHSFDSRYAQIGLINEKYIIGSAVNLF
jgi:conjugal transfer pilin signal peptidase TrbI